jgi:hypothetical protein
MADRFLQDMAFVLFRQRLTFGRGRCEVYRNAPVAGVMGREHF